MNNQEVFVPRPDELYRVATSSIPVDASSLGRTSVVFPAVSGGSGTAASPLNANGSNNVSRFNLESSSATPLRWSTTGLRVRLVFTKLNDPNSGVPLMGGGIGFSDAQTAGSDLPFDSIDPFLIGACISSIRVAVNGTNILQTSPNNYLSHYITSLIANHSRQSKS